jgi:hypothetical protein
LEKFAGIEECFTFTPEITNNKTIFGSLKDHVLDRRSVIIINKTLLAFFRVRKSCGYHTRARKVYHMRGQ